MVAQTDTLRVLGAPQPRGRVSGGAQFYGLSEDLAPPRELLGST